jgi:hypothetical protein
MSQFFPDFKQLWAQEKEDLLGKNLAGKLLLLTLASADIK